MTYKEIGDFLEKPYHFQVNRDGQLLNILLSRTCHTDAVDQVYLSKDLTISQGSSLIKILYTIKNEGNTSVRAIFGIEFNFNLLAGHAEDRYIQIDGQSPSEPNLASYGISSGIKSLCLIDKSVGLEIGIHTHKMADLWRFPIETASNSESGFEKVYQSSVIFLNWPLNLKSGEILTYNLDCWVKDIA